MEQILREFGGVKQQISGMEKSVDRLVGKVDELNSRSVKALEKLATHEERFVALQKQVDAVEANRSKQWKLVGIVVGAFWAVMQGAYWLVKSVILGG